VGQRLGHTEEHQAHAHAGSKEHGQPGQHAEFGLFLVIAQLDAAQAADGEDHQKADEDGERQDIEPAEVLEDLFFASKICKNTKSNTIVLAKNKQLIASGTGQTSRVDALKQAIEKAQNLDAYVTLSFDNWKNKEAFMLRMGFDPEFKMIKGETLSAKVERID